MTSGDMRGAKWNHRSRRFKQGGQMANWLKHLQTSARPGLCQDGPFSCLCDASAAGSMEMRMVSGANLMQQCSSRLAFAEIGAGPKKRIRAARSFGEPACYGQLEAEQSSVSQAAGFLMRVPWTTKPAKARTATTPKIMVMMRMVQSFSPAGASLAIIRYICMRILPAGSLSM